MNTYFKFRLITELTPIILAILVFIGIVIWVIIGVKKIEKIDAYMKNHGYEYYLRDVGLYGDKDWWAYRKGNISIDTDELYKIKFRDIKKKFL